MSTVTEKIEYFKKKQAEIMALHNEIEPKKQTLIQEAQEAVKKLEAEYTEKLNELSKPFDHAAATYKAELKAFCGITDGERANVLEMVEMIHKIWNLR